MLDAETKARIDSARDILVGKVPDPKSQVEQITIALIYKFMDDMDSQSEELGGKATFFTGEFTKYRWPNLLDKRHGGHERLLLYAESIEKMNENANIPQLFRDIFRGVFLPYRDPETLNLFLKEIDGFSYDHSERLGDAYEYLLSVLGTQGDAGQFRTPRQIIDFIVAVVDPQKHETVLDPACGTAGFLISAYKHILKANESLTPDERARLMSNFRGYDIAPDMVRLSRVNMYLHGFPSPIIHEYDTLTSEERWDERCDVIMANPPFMTPKGGIRPHNRFAITAKRSEVLFVDYIAEHLMPGGRAGVIVPEGIIFQSQNAYKNLRRMLVKDYLWAVVSLPAGVFNPYSGVKTSILFLDLSLAKRTDDVLFVKVENDGFDLGAQRRPIEKNDLPEALKAIEEWRAALCRVRDEAMADATKRLPSVAHAVSRNRLLESGDCILSGDRYRPAVVRANGKWPMVKLGEVCIINPARSEVAGLDPATEVSFVPMSSVAEHASSFVPLETKPIREVIKGYTYFSDGDVLLAKITPCFENGKSGIAAGLRNGIGFGSTEFIVIRPHRERIFGDLIYHFVSSDSFRERGIAHMTGSAGQQRVPVSFVESYEIPLPPLEEQERIVAELEGYRKVLEGARQVIANYKPTIRIDPEWPRRPLAELGSMEYGLTASGKDAGNARLIRITDITEDGRLCDSGARFVVLNEEAMPYLLKENDVLVARTGATYGKTLLFDDHEPSVFASYLIRLRFSSGIIPQWYWSFAQTEDYWRQARALVTGGGQPQFNGNVLKEVTVPLPPLDIQRRIVAELEAERALVEANRKLIELFERKIQDKLSEIWGSAADGASDE